MTKIPGREKEYTYTKVEKVPLVWYVMDPMNHMPYGPLANVRLLTENASGDASSWKRVQT